MMLLRNRVVTGVRSLARLPTETLAIFSYNCLSIAMNLAGSILVARYLGPAQKGIVNLFSLLMGTLGEFGVFGLNSALLYQLAHQATPLASVHAAALLASAFLGGCCLIIVVGFHSGVAWLFEGLPGTFILSSGLIAPLLIYRALWGSLLVGINRAISSYRINCAFAVLSLAGLGVVWSMGWLTAPAIIWLSIASLLGQCVYGFLSLARRHDFIFPWKASSLRDALGYGAVVHIGMIANYLHSRVDQLMINHFQGPRGVGIYTVSVAAAEMLWLIDYAIISSSLFRISSSDTQTSWHLTRRLFLLTSVVLVAAGALLAVLAPHIVRLLYGHEFLEAVWPLRLLLPGVITWGATRLLSQFISFNAGRPSLTSGAAILGSALNVAMNLYAIPRWGLSGAALASSLTYIATCLFLFVVFIRLREREEVSL